MLSVLYALFLLTIGYWLRMLHMYWRTNFQPKRSSI